MKRTGAVAALAVAAFLALGLSTGVTTKADGFEWVTDYNQGLKQAKESGKPIFLEFR